MSSTLTMAPLMSIGAPQPWLPPLQSPTISYSNPNKKDSSYNFCNIQPVCSLNCPQFCYYAAYLPPPPPSALLLQPSNPSSSSIHISSLLAAIIAALSTVFLVLFYFVALSPLLRHLRRRRSVEPTRPEIGLDENLIRELAVFKYTRGDGLIDGSDCAVCLSEFEEEEDLRLMPNCEHAFHVDCIDEWLKSHASCPLCRASMYNIPPPPPPPPPPPVREGGGERVVAVAEEVRSSGEESAAVPQLEEVIVICDGGEDRERGGEKEEQVTKRVNESVR